MFIEFIRQNIELKYKKNKIVRNRNNINAIERKNLFARVKNKIELINFLFTKNLFLRIFILLYIIIPILAQKKEKKE